MLARVFALILPVLFLHAQPQPGSISVHGLPMYGATAIDRAGNVFMTGTGGPVTSGAAQTQPGGGTCYDIYFHGGLFPGPCSDASIVKVDPSGKTVFGSLLGGPTNDTGTAITADASGNVYITGTTGGSFPTTSNAAIPASDSSKVFAAKLSADGSQILYSTYLPDIAYSSSTIAVDSTGNAYIAGVTTTKHAFVVKLNSDGSAIQYTTLLIGSNQEYASAVAFDASGSVIVTGTTASSDFPVTSGVFQSQLAGAQDVFVAKLDPKGNVVFSTYLGGTGADRANAIQTDSAGNIYIAGYTESFDFPTTSDAYQSSAKVPWWNVNPGGFIAKLAPDGAALLSSTYLPVWDGTGQVAILGVVSIAVTGSGDLYFAAQTGAGFPISDSAPQPCFGGAHDVLIARLDASGALRDATYLGGLYDETVWNIALADDGSVMTVFHSGGPHAFARIRFGDPGWQAPSCVSPAVLNSTSLFGSGAISPGEFVTLTGLGIGPDEGVVYQPDLQGRAPLSLSGVRVLFDGNPAPVLYAQARQVNTLVPFELAGRISTEVTIEYNGSVLGPITVPIVFGAPGIFRLEPNVSAQALATNEDGTRNGPSNPAPAGSIVSVWGTGFGPIYPGCETGGLNPPGPVNLFPGNSVGIFDGRLELVEYAGSAPTQLCGVVQINLRVPAGVAPGDFWFGAWAIQSTPTSVSSNQNSVRVKISVK